MRYVARRQAGRTTLPSEVHTYTHTHTETQTLLFMYMNMIHTILSVYTLKCRSPTPCNLLQIVGVLSPSEVVGIRLELARLLPSRDGSLPPDL